MTTTTEDRATLVDLLDRLLDKGAAVSGDITLSVADVDLVYVGLRALLTSIETARPDPDGPVGGAKSPAPSVSPPEAEPRDTTIAASQPAAAPTDVKEQPLRQESSSSADASDRSGTDASRIALDPADVEKGLCRLVLTVVELLRQLMERQAIRRMDGGSLSEQEVERLGDAFMALDEMMADLKVHFKLDDEDLNLDLGPLGKLL